MTESIQKGDIVTATDHGIGFPARVIGRTKEGRLILNAKEFEQTASGRFFRDESQVTKRRPTYYKKNFKNPMNIIPLHIPLKQKMAFLRREFARYDKFPVSKYKELAAILDKTDTKLLKEIAAAKIKFVSVLAVNRLVRRGALKTNPGHMKRLKTWFASKEKYPPQELEWLMQAVSRADDRTLIAAGEGMRGHYNANPHTKWYYGPSVRSYRLVIFSSDSKPTRASHGSRVKYAVGPFGSSADAKSHARAAMMSEQDRWLKREGIRANPKRRKDDLKKILGYTWEEIQDMQQKRYKPPTINTSVKGDYGADPLGDGMFRMVPSGDIVDFEERNKRLMKTNPPLPSKAVKIYDNVIEIRAQKGRGSLWPNEFFRHQFNEKKGKAGVYGLPDGSLMIKGQKRLWKNFNY